jgi:uncharacterized protein (DUF983 family)
MGLCPECLAGVESKELLKRATRICDNCGRRY